MMEDRLRKYVDYLVDNGYRAQEVDGKIKLSVNIEEFDIVLWCCTGRFFPYEIPDIYIGEESRKALPKIPHIHTDNSICIFDEDKVVPNFNAPEKLLTDTIDAAVSIIQDGIRGGNKGDFIDEFLEYWSVKAIFNAELFLEELDVAQSICWCMINKEEILITENSQRLQEICRAIYGESSEKCNKGMLIPIDGRCIEEIPQNDIDIIKLIEKYSSYETKYKSFMQKNIKKPCLIVFNIIIPRGNIIAGWMHPKTDIPKGFRKGHVDLKVAFNVTKSQGVAVAVENCHQNRLFTRGGDGKKVIWNKIALIGCGSVGSFLVDALKFYGSEQFILVDNERLQYENIARHVVGYSFVGRSKVFALSFLLQKHNPNIVCETYKENAHVVIEDRTDRINSCDVIFVAVASVAVEHHINRLMLDDRIKKPVIIVWVEPYLIGGHAVIVKKKQNLFKEIFDERTFEFKFSIVQNGSSYLKREAGCQSTYMPYSGFMLQQFIYRVLEQVISNCWSQKGNYLITWCGKLSEADKYEMKINKEYEKIEDYSLITRRID